MLIANYVLLAGGVLALVAGVATGWRAGGRNLVLMGIVNIAAAVGLMVSQSGDGLRVPALVLAGACMTGALLAANRPGWRSVRLEVTLGALLILGLWVLALLPQASGGVRLSLVLAVGALSVVFLGMLAWKAAARLRRLPNGAA